MSRGMWIAVLIAAGTMAGVPRTMAQDLDPEQLAGMQARSIGPAGMSGRVVSIDAVPSDPKTIFVGAATGGLWRSRDKGLTWEPVFDDQSVASIGAVAVHPRWPELVWVGTGEANPRNSISVGNGIYLSRDGGDTFEHLGLEHSEHIGKIVLDPDDADTVWVAALGPAWGEHTQRGVFRTVDAGKSWERVLFVDHRTGCADLAIDPQNPQKLFAAMWEFRRRPYDFRSGGPGSGFHVSRDGGTTWEKVTRGLPSGDLGRIGIGVAPSDPRKVYLIVEAEKNGIYASEDGGRSFELRTNEGAFGNRPFYYSQLRVDPRFPDRIYSLWSMVSVSDDGGRSWRMLVGWGDAHPDHHAMWVEPTEGELLIDGNDGGIAISYDRGETWRFASNLPLAQYYHIHVDDAHPYHVLGGMQDNGSWRGPSEVWENGGIRNHHFEEVCFGDGFATVPIPGDPEVGYAMSQQGYLTRWNLRDGERKSIRPWGPDGAELRFNWDAPIAVDPFDANGVYYGSQFLHYSPDRGETWDLRSEDLTTNREEWQRQGDSGGLTKDVTGAENYTTLKTIAPSPVQEGEVWVGTDDGRVWVTQDGGTNWQSVEENIAVPEHTWVSHIEASKFHAGAALVCFDDHRRSNWTPYLFETRDHGKTWTSRTTSDVRGYVHTVEQDPVREELWYLGTEFGLFVTLDGGASWWPFRHGFPTVAVMGLVVHPREHDLVIGTHGRAAYVLDDVRPLRELTEEVRSKQLHLFEPPVAQQYEVEQTGASRFPGATEFRGENPERGALLSYWMCSQTRETDEAGEAGGAEEAEPEQKPDDLVLEIHDAAGDLVRRMEVSKGEGLMRVVWDLRGDGVRSPGSADEYAPPGLEVLPGEYTIALVLGSERVERALRVVGDPRCTIPIEDRRAKLAIQRRADELRHTVDVIEFRMDEIRDQIARSEGVVEVARNRAREQGAEGASELHADVLEAAEALEEALEELDESLGGQSRDAQGITKGSRLSHHLRIFGSAVRSSWSAPNETERILERQARDQVRGAVRRLTELTEGPLAAFHAAVRKAELPWIGEITVPELEGG